VKPISPLTNQQNPTTHSVSQYQPPGQEVGTVSLPIHFALLFFLFSFLIDFVNLLRALFLIFFIFFLQTQSAHPERMPRKFSQFNIH